MKPFFHLLLERIPVRRWVRPATSKHRGRSEGGPGRSFGRMWQNSTQTFPTHGCPVQKISTANYKDTSMFRDIWHALSTISIAFFATKFASNVNKQIQRIHWQERLQVDSSVFLVRSHLDHETLL